MKHDILIGLAFILRWALVILAFYLIISIIIFLFTSGTLGIIAGIIILVIIAAWWIGRCANNSTW